MGSLRDRSAESARRARPSRLPAPWRPVVGAAVAAAAALALATSSAGAALAGDILVYVDGKTGGNSKSKLPPTADDYAGSNMEVVDWGLDKISYRIEGVPQIQTQDASKVQAIHFDPGSVPPELVRGRSLAASGDYDGAREVLGRVAKDANAPPWARSEAAFLAARSYADGSQPEEAAQALGAFKAAFKDSRWVLQATELRATALLNLGKIAEARNEFASLRSIVGAGDTSLQIDYYLVWIDERVAAEAKDQAGTQKALAGYEALVTKLSGKSSLDLLARKCQVGVASCMITLGRHADAKSLLEKVIKDATDQRVLAAAYNKLGTATWNAAPGDKAGLRQALLHYLRVVVLYGETEGAEDDCAEATFHAGELFRELRDQGPDWMARARREWNDVIARFPGSQWAAKAKLALAGR